MSSLPRLVPLMLVSAALACGPAGESVDGSDTGSSTSSTGDGPSGPGAPISTVTGVTSGVATDDSGSSSSGGDDESTGAAIDGAPTVALLVNGSAAPPVITRAGTQTITATLSDDHGLARLEVFVDDDPEPLAAVELPGGLGAVVPVALPIHDDDFNGAHSLRAVVHDDAMQATTSPPLGLSVALPEGGSPVWHAVSESKYASKALALAVDAVGDVIAVGEQALTADGHRSRMVIRKYAGETGELLWQREVPTQNEVATPTGRNIARGVAVDAQGLVYVVGEVRPDGMFPSLWLGKYTGDGLRVGTYVSDLPMSRGNGVAVGDDGQVYAVGYYRSPNLFDFATVANFNANLDLQWADTLGQPGALRTRAYGAAIDRNGDLVVVGSVQVSQTEGRGLVMLYTPKGARPWVRIASSVPSPRERLYSVLVTDDNEYVCAGRRDHWSDPRRLWLVRMSEDGVELDSETDIFTDCGDPNFDDDTDVCGVAQGPLGRLAMAGVGVADGDDFQVKQTRSDWLIHLWAPALDGPDHGIDRGLAVGIDGDGFVSAAGYETSLGLPRWSVTRRNP